MSIIEKLSSMKDKAIEVEQRISGLEKQVSNLNARLVAIDAVIKKISDIEIRVGELTKKIDQKVVNDEKRIQNIETQLNTKVSSFLSDLNRFENWFKEKERQHVEEENSRNKKVDASISHIKELEFQISDRFNKFVKETQKFETVSKEQSRMREQLEAQMDNLLETVAKNQKEMQDKMDSFSTRKDVSDLRSNLIKFDDILKNSIKQFETQTAEFDERLNRFVEYDVLHKHFGEIKVDLATTEGNFRKIVEDLKNEVDELKSEAENYPKIGELQEQHVDLIGRLKNLEKKTDFDFGKILSEIEKLGAIFAKKSEFSALSKEINNIERSMGPKIMQQLQSELEILKEQVIHTQNAIVELNSFIQEQLR